MKKQESIQRIIEILAVLKHKVEINNKIRFLDINIAAEDLLKKYLNLVYGYSLININIIENDSSFPAIDLGDKDRKIAIQITGNSSASKIKYTFRKFIEKGLYKDYENLKIVFLKDKKKYQSVFNTEGKFKFDKNKDLIELADTIKHIYDLDLKRIITIKDYLEKEIIIYQIKRISNAYTEYLKIKKIIEERIANNDFISVQEVNDLLSLTKVCFNRFKKRIPYGNIKNLNETIGAYNNFSRKPGEGDKIRNYVINSKLKEKINVLNKKIGEITHGDN